MSRLMTVSVQVMVAPNFHLPGELGERLLVPDGAVWRFPGAGERDALVPREAAAADLNGLVLLFTLPGHLRASFWLMLEQQDARRDFDAIVSEIVRFLTFKQLPPPEGAVFELILHRAGAAMEPPDLWAVINMGDDPVVVEVPGLRLRLGAGEGCRLPQGIAAEINPPVGELPDVLIRITNRT